MKHKPNQTFRERIRREETRAPQWEVLFYERLGQLGVRKDGTFRTYAE